MTAIDPPQPQSDEQPLVLVADNDAGVNDLLQDVLGRSGLRTVAVADGVTALRVIAEGGVALLVCDLEMAEMGGEEVLRHLAAMPDAPPVLVVSGYLDPHLERDLQGQRLVRGVFRKPFDVLAFADLAQRIARGDGGASGAVS